MNLLYNQQQAGATHSINNKMMQINARSTSIANRLREVLLNGQWVANTNMKEQVLSIPWQQAIAKIDGLNSIAALTYHINYYVEGLINAFENGRLDIKDKYSFQLPPIRTEDDWTNLVARFLNNAEHFVNIVEQMDDSLLDKPFIHEQYGSNVRNIEAIIEHSYYHLGQISMLKKMLTQRLC